jgi:methyl-accepting chemotaxis protein
VGVQDNLFLASPGRKRHGLPMGWKVWLGVGGLLALLACSIVVAVVLIVVLRGHEQHLNRRAVPYANAVAAAALDAKGVANDERGFLMTGDRRYVDEAEQRIQGARASFAAAAAVAPGRTQQRAVAEARVVFERWVSAVRREFGGVRRGDRQGPIRASFGPDRALRKRYEAGLARAQMLGARAIRSGDASVAAASSRSIAILLAFLLSSLVIGVAVAYWLVRSIANPVARLVAILSAG